ILWAGTNIVIKRSNLTEVPPEKLLLYQLAGSAVVGVLVMPFAGPAVRELALMPTLALLFQAIYVVAFTYVLWVWLLGRYPAAGLSSFAFLTPVFGVLCGGLLLGEPLSPRVFAALALIAIGLIIVNRPSKRHLLPDARYSQRPRIRQGPFRPRPDAPRPNPDEGATAETLLQG